MFLGHLGVALLAKRAAPKASLGLLLFAADLPDLVFPALVLLGAEDVRVAPGATRVMPLLFPNYPLSHSLLLDLAWALLVGLLYLRLAWYRRGAVVVGALVLSHWLLDMVSHRPDMPVMLSGPYLGLGLWNSLPATMAVELALFAAGVVVYLRKTWSLDGVGSYGFGAFVVFLAGMQLASYFGPPPPSGLAFAWVGLSTWLLIAWGAWVDRHREIAYDELAPGPFRVGS